MEFRRPSNPIAPADSSLLVACHSCHTRYRVPANRLEGMIQIQCPKCEGISPLPESIVLEVVPPPVLPTLEPKPAAVTTEKIPAFDLTTDIQWNEGERYQIFLKPGPLPTQKPLPPTSLRLSPTEELPTSSITPLTSVETTKTENKAQTLKSFQPFPPPKPTASVVPPKGEGIPPEPLLEEAVSQSDSVAHERLNPSASITLRAFRCFQKPWVLIFLILLIVGLSATGVLLENTPFFLKLFPSQHRLQLVGELTGKRLVNRYSGLSLLIIEGKVENLYPLSKKIRSIQLKGIGLDAQGTILGTKTVYAGNLLSETSLVELPLDEMERLFQNPLGENHQNDHLKEHQIIPFQMVFVESEQPVIRVSSSIMSYSYQDEIFYLRLPEL